MEEAPLPKREEKTWVVRRAAFVKELKKLSYMAAPMVAVIVSQYLMQVVSMMMVGHLGELSLFTPLFGLACALETLCGQAYGAEQYHKLGTYTYSAIISLLPICLPISVLWIFMDKLLVLVGQDPQVSAEACKYSIWLIPALVGYAILRSLIHYLQSQSFTLPMFSSSCATLCFHILLSWALVYKVDLGTKGAALAIGLSYWLNVIIIGLYMKYSLSCQRTRTFYLSEIFSNIKEFLRFGLPSVLMISLTTTGLQFVVVSGIGAAASTRVSNELGAGNPQAARLAVCVGMVLAVLEALIVSITLFCCRYFFGYAYSHDKEVVTYVAELVPLLCLSVIPGSLQAVLYGVARGSGWQHIGVYVNLVAYYLVGITAAAVLCFALHLRGKGLLIGIVTGSLVQAILLAIITYFTNWQKKATLARERIFKGTFTAENGSV